MFLSVLLFLGLFINLLVRASNFTFQPNGVPFEAPVTLSPGLEAHVIFSNLTLPRGIALDDRGALLVVERGLGVTAFSKVPTGWKRKVVIENTNFTHGIQVHGDQLYVSTPGEVLLFEYDSTTKSVGPNFKVLINGIPPDGELTTHTLQLEYSASEPLNILVGTGPFENIDITARDPSSGRSQIRSFPLPRSHTTSISPKSFLQGQLLAFGIRNPAGFAFSPSTPGKILYTVENGASIDNVTGLTAAFVNDNPADELESVNLLQPPVSYGFPDCTTLWNPLADPVGDPQFTNLSRGDQFSLHLDPSRDDKWCRKEKNNKPPILSFQAHSVPLDIKFYTPPLPLAAHALPRAYAGDAFVSVHGSFNRVPPVGYGIQRVAFDQGRPSSDDPTFVIQAADLNSCSPSSRCIRPAGLAIGKDGILYASSDSTGELFFLQSN